MASVDHKATGSELSAAQLGQCEARGIRLRELFAAMAMQGLAANPQAWKEKTECDQAAIAVEYADALLRELAKEAGER